MNTSQVAVALFCKFYYAMCWKGRTVSDTYLKDILTEDEFNLLVASCLAYQDGDIPFEIATPAVRAVAIWENRMGDYPPPLKPPTPAPPNAVQEYAALWVTAQKELIKLADSVRSVVADSDIEFSLGYSDVVPDWRFESWAAELQYDWAKNLDQAVEAAMKWVANEST